jgi:ATP-dependent helicase HrpA
LLLLAVPSPNKAILRDLEPKARLMLGRNPHGSLDALLEDCLCCAADALITACGGPPQDEAGFERLRQRASTELPDVVRAVLAHVQAILTVAHTAASRVTDLTGSALAPSIADIRAQLGALVGPGFVTATGAQRLPDLTRYLRGVEKRLDKLPRDPDRDQERMRRVQALDAAYRELRDEIGDGPGTVQVRWMIEELRISYFAQELRTAYPVSEKRIYRMIDDVTA